MKKIVGIRNGLKIGVFELDNKELQALINGVKKQEYKYFITKEEAQAYVYDTEEPPLEERQNTCSCCKYELTTENSIKHISSLQKHIKLTQEGLDVYTDGSHFNKDGKSIACGIGVFFNEKSADNVAAPMHYITKVGPRNIMRAELAACILALKITHKYPYIVNIITDSHYILDVESKLKIWGINKWKNHRGQKIINWDLLEQIFCLIKNRKVTFKHINSHSKNKQNDMADYLAKLGAQKDIGFKYLKPVNYK